MLSKQQYSWIILYCTLFGLYCRAAYLSLVVPYEQELDIFSCLLLAAYWITNLVIGVGLTVILINILFEHLKYFLYYADTVSYKKYFSKYFGKSQK